MCITYMLQVGTHGYSFYISTTLFNSAHYFLLKFSHWSADKNLSWKENIFLLKWNPLVWENGILSNYSYICLGKTNVGTNNTYVILVSVLHTNNNNIHSFQKNTTGWKTKQVNIHILVLFAKFLELTDTEGSQSKIEFLPYMQHHFLLMWCCEHQIWKHPSSGIVPELLKTMTMLTKNITNLYIYSSEVVSIQ